MKFTYADELKKKFDVYGHFYSLKLSSSILKCRSILEIKRKNKLIQIPDIIVIMMDSGSSIPSNKNYEPKIFSKDKFYLDQTFYNTKHSPVAVKNAIKFYNNERLHLSLDYKTPNSVYKKVA